VTALHCAAYEGHDKVVKVLIVAKAAVDMPDNDGWTALHYATSRKDNEKAIKILLDAGADPAMPDNSGQMPLDLASKKGRATVVHMLETAMANLSIA
jgi:ankyrin repeat protein